MTTNDPAARGQRAPEQATEFQQAIRHILQAVGEDADRDGLLKTPERVENAMRFLTRGYRMRAEDVIGDAVFEESHDNMVLVRDIEFYSLCEHHMLPFFGVAHVAYIPGGRIVGLSKLARVVDVFARRLQVQERLTDEVADAIERTLRPRGVGVVIEAAHFCMQMRGVEKQGSRTITSSLRGVFRDDPRTREEFLRLAHAR
ncbi:MAG: GTP cyclohydrolase I FolE [Gemmatimonadales bacterium]|nr:GTP cyclohydrolase I FolE [Gemmatimonadales bacterium]